MKSTPEEVTIAPSSGPMLPAFYRIQRTREETADTFTLELAPPPGLAVPAFGPGQFNMLYAFGVGEAPISISGNPAHPQKLIHTIREVGPVTRALRRLKPGDLVGVRGPFGSSWPVEASEGHDVVVVAGGIGLAPLRPAMHALIENRNKFGRVVLFYGTRSPADILYLKDVEKWRGRLDMSVHVTVDRAMGSWWGSVGVVTTLLGRGRYDPKNTIAMVCGPEIMMSFTVRELERRGVALDNIYISMERNMKCAVGFCGHCQFGPTFICKDGPIFAFNRIKPFFELREV